jgi:signal transduction histidine kinase
LLNNAAKYTHPGGTLRLGLEVSTAGAVFTISDNGIGMTPQLMSRAFELFSQGELTSDRTSGGLGVGLALVKSLVELHGGRVSANSAGPGRGSEFTVTLPAALVCESMKSHLQETA